MLTYSSYKDSEVKWIGAIPSSWSVISFKRTHNGTNVGESIDKEFCTDNVNDYTFYTAGLNPIRTNYHSFPEWKKTQVNDLLLARNGTPYVYLPLINSLYSDHIIRVSIKDTFDKRFLRYCLQQSINTVAVDTVSISTWSASLWNEQKIPLPSFKEQQSISHYLDKKVSHIDSLITEAKASIEEYKQWKASIIYEAVTKGLDPNVEMKDSGVEWIGRVPASWGIAMAKQYVSICHGSDPQTDGNVPVYGSGASSFKTCGEYKEGPTVLIGRKGATLHIPHYVEGRYWNVDTAFDVKVKSEMFDLKYYFYLANCFDYKYYMSQTTLPSMTQSNYNAMKLPIPSIEEQQSIVEHLDSKCKSIDELICEKEQLITDLESYKKSLIFEVVTGKRKVV